MLCRTNAASAFLGVDSSKHPTPIWVIVKGVERSRYAFFENGSGANFLACMFLSWREGFADFRRRGPMPKVLERVIAFPVSGLRLVLR